MLIGSMSRYVLPRSHMLLLNRAGALKSRKVFSRSSTVMWPASNIHTHPYVGAKKFTDTENDYAREILLSSIVAAPNVVAALRAPESTQQFDEIIDWEPLSDRELLDQFHQVVEICARDDELCISDERFDSFVHSFVSKMPQFDEEQLVETLKLLVKLGPTPNINTRNYSQIWEATDKACLAKVPSWNTEKLLFMADQWYPLRLAKVGKFVGKAVFKISSKLRKLNKDDLVRTVFYINLTRVPVENMIDIELNLKNNFYRFDIDDLAILCMGFFKTQTPIRSVELISKIYQLTMHNASTVKDISLAAILKLLRYSSRIPHAQCMEQFLTVFTPEVPRISLFCCLHLALLGSDIHLGHQPCLEAVIERFIKDIKLLRLKDMERIAFAIAQNNMTHTDNRDITLLSAILDEMPSRIDEITTYPKSYLTLLHFLTLKDVYREELITAAFEPRFLHMTYGRNVASAGREVISLDGYLRINLRDGGKYSGNYFPEKQFKIIAKMTQDYIPSREYRLSKSDRMLLEILETLQKRHKFAHITHLLPHYQRPDVALLWDSNQRQLLDVASRCPKQYSGNILSRQFLLKDDSDRQELKLISIVAGSWNCYIRGQDRVTGGFAMKLKQLRLIGFEPVVIPWYEWPINSEEAMDTYLFEKLNPLLEQQ
ncbi:uncharacterized protein LOC129772247 [Toxorhynchites rutilus septentrionalis]|uniref:uncharacterized protein LOC129772247 n=1 Tax=Toxorhynchites rutilus septentrionalis TaxID=329112 RepID=UPI00247B230E|nr:uncharacterized protein LOC129772247 [Toxorhynchites rutilus septentrionalis]